MSIRVLIADDQNIIRAGLTTIPSKRSGHIAAVEAVG